MMEAILDYLMIESTMDFWLFVGGFMTIGGSLMYLAWKAIRRIVGR